MLYLLAPAGSPAALKAALDAGADEIYVGGPVFNARMNAANFTKESLAEASALCRARGARLHVALNTLLFDREMNEALEYVGFLAEKVKPDALIVQDAGLIASVRREFPGIALHASTQMRLHSPGDVEFVKQLGFTRAVLARELCFDDIKKCASVGLETEIFAHGALCVCESGGCLMSSVIGGRSGNRGECAQPCRLPYKGKSEYPLSLKDLCLAGHIKEIADSGVTSLKIEGRMKSPDYVYAVTSVYRRLIDENRNADGREIEYLSAVFSRGGFTDGYFTGRITRSMFGSRSDADKEKSRAVRRAQEPPYPPRAKVEAPAVPPFVPPEQNGSELISPKEQRGTVLRFEGGLPSEELLKKYAPSAARIDVPLRDALDKRLAPYRDKLSAILPRSVFCAEMPGVEKRLDALLGAGIKHLTVNSVWQFRLALKGFFLHGDYTLNVTNRRSIEFYENYPLSSIMISPETDGGFPKGSRRALEYICYGRTPLMYTRTCIIANIAGCARADRCNAVLTDRAGAKFPVISGESHTNTVYNSLPAFRLDRKPALKASGVGLVTLLFTDENEKRISEVIEYALGNRKDKPRFEYTRR